MPPTPGSQTLRARPECRVQPAVVIYGRTLWRTQRLDGGSAPADAKLQKAKAAIASARFQTIIDLRLRFRLCRVVEYRPVDTFAVKVR